jgi:hypothetical protein
MVNLTKQPTDVFIRPSDADVPRSEVVTLLDEMVTGIDAASLRPVASSASNVTVTTADVGKVFTQTAESTVNLPAAASAGNGFTFAVRASGGAVTLDPNGSEQINGDTTLVLADGEAAHVYCTGTAWQAIVVSGLGSLGSAATEDVGTATGDVVQLEDVDGVPGLPAVSGKNLTDIQGWTALAATATTSGTAFDFTSLPAGINEVEIWFKGVSGNGTDDFLVQIGTGGSPTTTGYVAGSGVPASTSRIASTAGFPIFSDDAANALYGVMKLYRIDGNEWVSSHAMLVIPSNGVSYVGGGGVTLAGALGNIRITSLAGSQVFDAGKVRVQIR